jgi:hypothetical protein
MVNGAPTEMPSTANRSRPTAAQRTPTSSATPSALLLGLGWEVHDGLALQLLRTLGVDTESLRTQLRPRAAG